MREWGILKRKYIMISRPKPCEAKSIQELINLYANTGLLPLSLHEIYERIRDFFIYKIESKIVGAASLHIIWEDLAEFRSLAVHANYRHQGIGKALVIRALDEAKDLHLKKIFLLTNQKEYFKKMGFQLIDKSELPHKVWSDCIKCIKFPHCDEVAMIIEL
jgi:amino-acid N-acetyltransferase